MGSFGSYGAALADGRMDAAFVATPPESHLELVLEALGRGKDVIVEKPAFTRAADFERVAREVTRTGRRVLVAENYCYKPRRWIPVCRSRRPGAVVPCTRSRTPGAAPTRLLPGQTQAPAGR